MEERQKRSAIEGEVRALNGEHPHPNPDDNCVEDENDLLLLDLEDELSTFGELMRGLIPIKKVSKSTHIEDDDRMPAHQTQIGNIGPPVVKEQRHNHHQRTHEQLQLRFVEIVFPADHVQQHRDEDETQELNPHSIIAIIIHNTFTDAAARALPCHRLENKESLIHESLIILFVSSDSSSYFITF
jgi:hypothetical protein